MTLATLTRVLGVYALPLVLIALVWAFVVAAAKALFAPPPGPRNGSKGPCPRNQRRVD